MPTDRFSEWDTDTQTIYSSTAFTPAANSFLLAGVRSRANDGPGAIASIAGHGTWELLADFTDDSAGATRSRVEVWGCVVGGSPSSDEVDVTYAAENPSGCHLHIIEFTSSEIDTSGGDPSAILVGAATTVNALSLDLGALGDPDNMCVAFFGTQADETITASDGTIMGQSQGAQPTSAFAGVYGVGNQTLAASGAGGTPCGVGVELLAPSGVVIESLAASVLGVGSVTADMAERVELASSTLGAAVVTADLGGTEPAEQLAADVLGSSSVAAALDVRVGLAAAVFGVGTTTANLTGTGEVVSTRQDVQQVAYWLSNGNIAF